MELDKYLEESEIINFSHPDIKALAKTLAKDCKDDEAIAKNCFLYVRDNIRHSGDHKEDIITIVASDVLKHKTGWCYTKAHLLAALLRANGIPAGFCYQRLRCNEYKDGTYCLHGLNAMHLKKYGWYRVDSRGNKEGVNAQFSPPHEQLAFKLEEGEIDLPDILPEPRKELIDKLKKCESYDMMINDFPDIKG